MEIIEWISGLLWFVNSLFFVFLMVCGVKIKWYIRVIIAFDTIGASEIGFLTLKYYYVIQDILFGQHRD